MKLNTLTLIVTDNCNFNCSYCFQKTEKKDMDTALVEKALDFFYPYLDGKDKTAQVNFYGGEPLLVYKQVVHAIHRVEELNRGGEKKIAYNLTTNGSLLTREMLDFFNGRSFGLMLSFDGLAQELDRRKGSLEKALMVMEDVKDYPGIDFEINSVFSPRTVDMLYDSLRYIIDRGGSNVTFDVTTMEDWSPGLLETLKQELEKTVRFLASYYREHGTIPITNFRGSAPGKGIFRCNAGAAQMAVTPGGELWGCFLFHDYFKTRPDHPQYGDFSFGTLDGFIAHYPSRWDELLPNYSELRQNLYKVEESFCFLCPDLEGCAVCPVNAVYSSGSVGHISRLNCELQKIRGQAKKRFRELVEEK